jgi:chloramphenicol 3-O-phosphotransferase
MNWLAIFARYLAGNGLGLHRRAAEAHRWAASNQTGLFSEITSMIIIVNGSLGVGKSSVADQLHYKFDKSVHLDGDYIGDVYPFEIHDDARIRHLYRTLELLIGFHQKNGYHNFVVNYVFESPESLQALLDLLHPLDSSIHTYWLTCSEEEQAKRIQKRKRAELEWELKRFVELQRIQAEAAQQGFIGKQVDTTGLTSEEVAEKIWKDVSSQ